MGHAIVMKFWEHSDLSCLGFCKQSYERDKEKEKRERDGEKQTMRGNLCMGKREKKEDLIFRVGSWDSELGGVDQKKWKKEWDKRRKWENLRLRGFFFFLITIGLYAMCLSSYLKWETTGGY